MGIDECKLSGGELKPALLAGGPDFVIFYKPPGLETISGEGGEAGLLGLARELLDEPGLLPVHRLDRDTSGAQLFARHPAAEKGLVRLFRERRVDKTYLALCLGVPPNGKGVINRGLSPWSGGRRPIRILKRGGLAASTAYERLAASAELPGGWRAGLLSFSPRQGRTHQIRVHAAAFGHPVLGDDRYGDRAANKLARDSLGLGRQALHAWRLAFDWRGERVAAVCPLPGDLRRAGEKAGFALRKY
ncbi:MAG: RNA pseudouridine synthase [Planctomycetota bacterium]|jgi:23S rRNA pseudouridine955/2504/2580 synthase|nr:RNA pseudouridine synthase [Planctomycetota bacterium]